MRFKVLGLTLKKSLVRIGQKSFFPFSSFILMEREKNFVELLIRDPPLPLKFKESPGLRKTLLILSSFSVRGGGLESAFLHKSLEIEVHFRFEYYRDDDWRRGERLIIGMEVIIIEYVLILEEDTSAELPPNPVFCT